MKKETRKKELISLQTIKKTRKKKKQKTNNKKQKTKNKN